MSSLVVEFVFLDGGDGELLDLSVPRVDGLPPVGPHLPGVEGLVEVLANFEPTNPSTVRAIVSEENIK